MRKGRKLWSFVADFSAELQHKSTEVRRPGSGGVFPHLLLGKAVTTPYLSHL
jgi:hypothetical protein